jgi:hypothetical protein
MRSAKTVGISLLALLVMAAVSASTASAAIVKVEKNILRTAKGVLAAGAEVKIVSTNTVVTNTAGKLECTEVSGTGTVKTNEAKIDELSLTTVAWTGAEAEKECKSTSASGPAKIAVIHAPWIDVLYDNGDGRIVVSEKAPAIVEEFPKNAEKCEYYYHSFKARFKIGKNTAPEAITQTMEKDPLKILKTKSTSTCPETAEMSGTFTVTSGTEAVEAEQSP